MAKMNFDEDGLLDEPCLTCEYSLCYEESEG